MAYEHIEQITERKGEKVALFLTIENATGIVLCAMPIYILTSAMPFVLRVVLMGMAAALGLILTLDIGGLPLYARLLWRGRGLLRMRINRRRIVPEQFIGAAAVRPERAIRATGAVRMLVRRRSLLEPDARQLRMSTPIVHAPAQHSVLLPATLTPHDSDEASHADS
jgi:hypothetical protein